VVAAAGGKAPKEGAVKGTGAGAARSCGAAGAGVGAAAGVSQSTCLAFCESVCSYLFTPNCCMTCAAENRVLKNYNTPQSTCVSCSCYLVCAGDEKSEVRNN
jgi:hypothetical protein